MIKKTLLYIFLLPFSFVSSIEPPSVLCSHRYETENLSSNAYYAEGTDAMYKFIYKNISWECGGGSHQGTVELTFIIDEVGGIWNIKVRESVAPCLDEEIIKAIKQMPNWVPATIDGINVCSDVFISVRFRLGYKETVVKK